MEFKNLEQKLKDLAEKFKNDLVDVINNKGHNKTGELVRSIKFSFVKTGDDYSLELDALEYLQYLDNGNLLKDFLESKKEELSREIPKAVKKDIVKELNDL